MRVASLVLGCSAQEVGAYGVELCQSVAADDEISLAQLRGVRVVVAQDEEALKTSQLGQHDRDSEVEIDAAGEESDDAAEAEEAGVDEDSAVAAVEVQAHEEANSTAGDLIPEVQIEPSGSTKSLPPHELFGVAENDWHAAEKVLTDHLIAPNATVESLIPLLKQRLKREELEALAVPAALPSTLASAFEEVMREATQGALRGVKIKAVLLVELVTIFAYVMVGTIQSEKLSPTWTSVFGLLVLSSMLFSLATLQASRGLDVALWSALWMLFMGSWSVFGLPPIHFWSRFASPSKNPELEYPDQEFLAKLGLGRFRNTPQQSDVDR
mmetsp:Transcript_25733/g.56729  ORF Transcript_25733/g.56729 Transcript_25733/m.56729 type:complete len:326 (+) Transcript_25733:76-1053(+)